MKTLEIAAGVDLDGPGTAVGTAIDLLDQPMQFQPGATATVMGSVVGFGEGAEGAITLQGRETTDDAWADLFSVGPTEAPFKMADVTLTRYVRYAVASATAADGRGSLYLASN